ncbi:MAG: hypothetical protein AABW93_03710 [Nanoarchaeota archaeon]
MPELTANNNQGNGGDDAAAKAAADAAAAAAAAGNGGGNGEENVTMKKFEVEKLQADLKKSNEDRDNYKKGLLQKKADERNLGGEGQGGGGDNIIDEKKVGEIATAATNKALRAASEKTAKRAFLQAHPEYVDDAQWTELMSNLTFKGTELIHDDVLGRMDAALLEHKRSTGKLEEHLKAEHERGVREGRIQGELGSGHGTGGAGDRNEGGKGTGTLSPKGEEMARAMHVDPEKARKVDPSKDNVINIL